MNDYSATGNYYTIGHVATFTGLTDRTIRNYLAAGVLEGEKINGVWHFTAEQVDAFMTNSAVRRSIQAGRNAIVYDFLLQEKKQQRETCMILDLPGEDWNAVSEYFCAAANSGAYHDLRFAMDAHGDAVRVILQGRAEEVAALAAGYDRERT